MDDQQDLSTIQTPGAAASLPENQTQTPEHATSQQTSPRVGSPGSTFHQPVQLPGQPSQDLLAPGIPLTGIASRSFVTSTPLPTQTGRLRFFGPDATPIDQLPRRRFFDESGSFTTTSPQHPPAQQQGSPTSPLSPEYQRLYLKLQALKIRHPFLSSETVSGGTSFYTPVSGTALGTVQDAPPSPPPEQLSPKEKTPPRSPPPPEFEAVYRRLDHMRMSPRLGPISPPEDGLTKISFRTPGTTFFSPPHLLQTDTTSPAEKDKAPSPADQEQTPSAAVPAAQAPTAEPGTPEVTAPVQVTPQQQRRVLSDRFFPHQGWLGELDIMEDQEIQDDVEDVEPREPPKIDWKVLEALERDEQRLQLLQRYHNSRIFAPPDPEHPEKYYLEHRDHSPTIRRMQREFKRRAQEERSREMAIRSAELKSSEADDFTKWLTAEDIEQISRDVHFNSLLPPMSPVSPVSIPRLTRDDVRGRRFPLSRDRDFEELQRWRRREDLSAMYSDTESEESEESSDMDESIAPLDHGEYAFVERTTAAAADASILNKMNVASRSMLQKQGRDEREKVKRFYARKWKDTVDATQDSSLDLSNVSTLSASSVKSSVSMNRFIEEMESSERPKESLTELGAAMRDLAKVIALTNLRSAVAVAEMAAASAPRAVAEETAAAVARDYETRLLDEFSADVVDTSAPSEPPKLVSVVGYIGITRPR